MSENPNDEPSLEKTMASGEVMTLASGPYPNSWDVDGDNRWHRQYKSYTDAKAEYDRWN